MPQVWNLPQWSDIMPTQQDTGPLPPGLTNAGPIMGLVLDALSRAVPPPMDTIPMTSPVGTMAGPPIDTTSTDVGGIVEPGLPTNIPPPPWQNQWEPLIAGYKGNETELAKQLAALPPYATQRPALSPLAAGGVGLLGLLLGQRGMSAAGGALGGLEQQRQQVLGQKQGALNQQRQLLTNQYLQAGQDVSQTEAQAAGAATQHEAQQAEIQAKAASEEAAHKARMAEIAETLKEIGRAHV
jgi:hypothetical protein